jgi:phospholipid-binding lipoprotein MlaA
MNLVAAIRAVCRRARAPAGIAAALVVATMAGCATGPDANPKDPLEPFNRKMFAFNDALDTHVLKPVATGYTKVVPHPVRTGIHNFFGNFSDVWSTVNQLLQGKFDNTARMTMRVLTNTFMGLGGILDPATEFGLEKQPEDLGQTFGRWGVPPGPYLVLPLFGPSDVRDAIALPADDYVSPALLVNGTGNKLIVDAVGLVDARANLLGATDLINDIALDRYTFIRDAYITRRRSLVYDGNPPEEKSDDNDSNEAPGPGAPASGAAPGGAASAPGGAASDASTLPPQPQPERRHAQEPPLPPSGASAPSPPVPGVSPAPLPASAPPLPIPPSGPVPVPPPPASAAAH